MDALDPASRVAMEGHRPGSYLRLRFSGQCMCQRRTDTHLYD